MSRTIHKPYFNTTLQQHSSQKEAKKSSNAGKIFITFIILSLFGLVSTGAIGSGSHLNLTYMGIIAGIVYMLSVINIRYGLAATVIGFSLSPDIPFAGIELRLEDFLIPIIGLAWFFKNMNQKGGLSYTSLKKPFLIILVLGLFSTVIALGFSTLHYTAAMQYYFKNVEYFVLFFLALNILKTREDVYFILATLLLSSAFMGIFGTYQVLTKGESFGFRVSGPNGETANILGGYYVFCMSLAAGLFFCTKNIRLKVILLIYLGVFMMWPLLQTLSRASFVSMLFALLFLGIIGKQRILFWLGGFMAIFPLLFPEYLFDRMRTVLGVVGVGDMPTSMQDKLLGWGLLWDNKITTDGLSLLLGNGVGSIRLNIDNEYMKILGETGLLGLLMFIIMIVAVFKLSWKVFKESSNTTDQGLCLGFLGALIALLIQGFSGTVFTTMRTMEPFMLLCALICILHNINQHEKTHRHSGKPIDKDHQVPAMGRYSIVEIFRKNYRQSSE